MVVLLSTRPGALREISSTCSPVRRAISAHTECKCGIFPSSGHPAGTGQLPSLPRIAMRAAAPSPREHPPAPADVARGGRRLHLRPTAKAALHGRDSMSTSSFDHGRIAELLVASLWAAEERDRSGARRGWARRLR